MLRALRLLAQRGSGLRALRLLAQRAGVRGGRGSVPGEGRGAPRCPSGSRGQRRGTCSGGLGGVQVHCHSLV